jgi:hypothetical protein
MAADILDEGADLIEVGGLAKGTLFKENEEGGLSYCAVGAMTNSLAYGRFSNARPGTWQKVTLAMRKYIGIWTIPNWNNAPERTATEVIDTMRRAAKDLRNEAPVSA